MDLARSPASAPLGTFDLIFLDPLYKMIPDDACGALASSLRDDGCSCEHARRMHVPDAMAIATNAARDGG